MVPNSITFSNPPIRVAYAIEEPVHVQEWTESNVELLIRSKAKEYGVDPEKAMAVAKCESQLIYDVQSFHIRPDGTREESYGVWQIHLPAHPTVTREMAIDPVWATNWAMEHLQKGKWSMWSCSKIMGII